MKSLSSVLVLSLISQATAYSTGAGACPIGEAAPGGSHLSGTPGLVGPLSEGNYTVTVGGINVTNGDTLDISMLDFDITVTAEGTQFKGILIRIGGATADQVTSEDLTAPASACGDDDVGSATHSNASLKTVGTASVSLDGMTRMDVDISVVLENSATASTFYYSKFQVRAVGDAEANPDDGIPAGSTMTDSPATTPAETPVEAPASGIVAYGTVTAIWVSAVAVLL